MQWDESAWSQGKDGPGAGGGDGRNDPHLRPLLSSAAPTRNNSPSSGARNSLHPSSKQQEDEDLAQAMAMSQGNEWFQAQAQESGVVSSAGQETQFGPANRNDYNPRDWAMVPTGPAMSGEIVPDAEAEERVGKMGEPRMLKQLPGSGEYLANLITILANVYGAREAMLMRERVKMEYGQDAEWWKGHAISMPKIVALGDPSGESVEEGSDQYDDLIAEVQRLMAFLFGSARSYGSAGALLQTDAIKNSNARNVRSNTMLELFLQTWTVAALSKAGEEDDLAFLFTTTIGTNDSEGATIPDMSLIDMPVDTSPDDSKPQELLELLDGLLWDTSDPDAGSDNYIERPADILVMRLRQRNVGKDNKQLKVVVPAEFYVDKYLREHIESTRATRAEMARGKRKVEKIERIERKLRTWRNPGDGKEMDAAKLLGHTSKYLEEEKRLSGGEEPSQHQDITSKLAAVISSIDAKLATLAQEKEKTLAAITSMSRAPPPGLEAEDQEHRYILRGVATKPNITYVLAHESDEHAEDGDGEDDAFDDADDNTYAGMRWWRLEYDVLSSGLGAKVSKVRVGDYDVLRAVELEHEKAMLVYGSMAVNAPPAPDEVEALPLPLQEFVKRDNALFAAELESERLAVQPPPGYQQQQQRSFDLTGNGGDADSGIDAGDGEGEGKRGSMDSTRAEGRSNPPSPPDYDDDVGGFERHHSFGLGPDLKGRGYGGAGGGYDGQGDREMDVDDAPVAEIRLDGDGDGEGGDEGVEMVERVHGSLVPGLGASVGGGRGKDGGESDVEMGEGK